MNDDKGKDCNYLGLGDYLKRLASAVQLRPWPPNSKELTGIACCPSSPLSVRIWRAVLEDHRLRLFVFEEVTLELSSTLVRCQSVFVGRMAENRS